MEGYQGGLRSFILSSETSIRLNNLDIFADSIEIQVGFSDLDADLSPYVSRVEEFVSHLDVSKRVPEAENLDIFKRIKDTTN